MLLDSHVVLDVIGALGGTGPKTLQLLGDAHAFVSAVSTWELTMKINSDRLRLERPLGEYLEESGFNTLPFLVEHSLRIGEVGVLGTNDPFDRALLTQAMVEGLEFYTWDRAILAAELPFVRDARA